MSRIRPELYLVESVLKFDTACLPIRAGYTATRTMLSPGRVASATLMIRRTGSSSAMSLGNHARPWFHASWLPIATLALISLVLIPTRCWRRSLGFVPSIALLVELGYQLACGAQNNRGTGNHRAPAGTYTIIVTETSGSLTHSTSVGLTVYSIPIIKQDLACGFELISRIQ